MTRNDPVDIIGDFQIADSLSQIPDIVAGTTTKERELNKLSRNSAEFWFIYKAH